MCVRLPRRRQGPDPEPTSQARLPTLALVATGGRHDGIANARASHQGSGWRLHRATAPAAGRPALGRPLRLLRSLRPDRRRARIELRRAAASAHRPGHAHLPVRRRDDASRLDRRGPAHRAGRRELDVGRARHRPFRTGSQGLAVRDLSQPRPAALDRPAGGRRGVGAFVPACARRQHSAGAAERRRGSRRRRLGVRRDLADRDALANAGARGRLRCRFRQLDRTACARFRARPLRARPSLRDRRREDRRIHDGCPSSRHVAQARGAAWRPRRTGRRRAARPSLRLVELRLEPARTIQQAEADWQAQRFDRIPGETEFIPLPERHP